MCAGLALVHKRCEIETVAEGHARDFVDCTVIGFGKAAKRHHCETCGN
jgi:hypothetical protein